MCVEKLNQLLAEASVSKIVYSLVMPETESVVDEVLDGTGAAAGGRERFHDMFREAWTQKQDTAHEEFFQTWKTWSAPVVQLDAARFPFAYPTGGASEAIREAIHAHGVCARKAGVTPRIHLFEGEYEGFSAYAAAAGIEAQTHHRRSWRSVVDALGDGDQFYLSQPSAIDGMVWDEYDAFITCMEAKAPHVQLMLDLTYVGCISREFTVRADTANIAAVFLSLSKPAGAYYHRIGGMLSRHEYPGLFGNKWFKNLTSLSIGTQFMKRFGVYDLPRKYRSIQERVTHDVSRQLGLALEPADVLLMATGQPSPSPTDLEKFLMRGSPGEQRLRACLTPRMAHAIDPALTPSVSARYYERLDP